MCWASSSGLSILFGKILNTKSVFGHLMRSPGTPIVCKGHGRRCPRFLSKNLRALRKFWTCGHLRTYQWTPADTSGHQRTPADKSVDMSAVTCPLCPQYVLSKMSAVFLPFCGHLRPCLQVPGLLTELISYCKISTRTIAPIFGWFSQFPCYYFCNSLGTFFKIYWCRWGPHTNSVPC